MGHARRVVGGNIWTASRISGGTDAIIAWLEHPFSKDVVGKVINIMRYNHDSDPSNDPFGKINDVQDAPRVASEVAQVLMSEQNRQGACI